MARSLRRRAVWLGLPHQLLRGERVVDTVPLLDDETRGYEVLCCTNVA